MTHPLVLTLPFALLMADNHRLIPARGRLIASPRYRAAKEVARLSLLAQRPAFHPVGDLAVRLCFWFPDRRKRDISNYVKFVHDCLTGIAYHDDAQIAHAEQVRVGVDRTNPRMTITITPILPLTQQEEAA